MVDGLSFEMKNFLGNRMRQLRLLFGFTQKDIADALNISRPTYSYYELGDTRPDPAVLGRLAYYYNVPVDVFYSDAVPVDVQLQDVEGRRHRTGRSAAIDPQRVGELRPAERSLILLIRSSGLDAKDVLEGLENYLDQHKQ